MQTPAPEVAPEPPRIPTGPELWDTIMGQINPDLTSEGLKHLDEKYTPEQQAALEGRWETDRARCQEAADGTIATLQMQVKRYEQTPFRKIEDDDRAREERHLDGLTNEMYHLAA
jgi:hypothetical protein